MPPQSTLSHFTSCATGQSDPTSSSLARRSAHPTGRGFELSSLRMASISVSAIFFSWRLKQAPINAGRRSFDGYRANDSRIELGWSDAADDGVAVALLLHGFETGEQQGCPDSIFSCVRVGAGGTEEVATGCIVAGKPQNVL